MSQASYRAALLRPLVLSSREELVRKAAAGPLEMFGGRDSLLSQSSTEHHRLPESKSPRRFHISGYSHSLDHTFTALLDR